jgi:hypothetical protein
LSANGVWLKPIGAAETAPVTLILDDKGKAASAGHVAERLNRGEQVLALDLSFHGDAWKDDSTVLFLQMVNTTGGRPLGVETAQLLEIARWAKERAHVPTVRLESSGIRNQVVSLVASALQPEMFSEVVNRSGMRSLGHLLSKPVEYKDAPELFCLDLLRETDIDRLSALGAPVRVIEQGSSE